MFFPKLRRKAKWVFAFIAMAFGLSFVVAGVGSGFGSGIGDYLSELFNRQPGANPGASVEDAEKRVEESPNDPEAQLELANALMAAGRTDDAIAQLEQYTEANAEDVEALQQLAGLYLLKANEADQRAEAAQASAGVAFFRNELFSDERFLEALPPDPFTEQQQQRATEVYSDATIQAQRYHSQEADVWQRISALRPDDTQFVLELARSSQQANQYDDAIAAYERYLELAPEDDPTAEQVEQVLEQLKAFQEQQQNANQPAGG